MTQLSLTRRRLAQIALAGAAGALLPAASRAQNTQVAPMPVPSSSEGALLAQAVPPDVGTPLTPAQTREVAKALKGYPGSFAKARAFAIPEDVPPAWVGDPPPARDRKGRGK